MEVRALFIKPLLVLYSVQEYQRTSFDYRISRKSEVGNELVPVHCPQISERFQRTAEHGFLAVGLFQFENAQSPVSLIVGQQVYLPDIIILDVFQRRLVVYHLSDKIEIALPEHIHCDLFLNAV